MRKLIVILLALGLGLSACSTARQKLTPQGNVDFKTAQVYYSQKNVERAEEYYVKVLKDNPEHAVSLRRMGDINLHKGENNPEKAVSYYSEAFDLYTKAIAITEAYPNPTDEEKLAVRDMKKRKESCWVKIFNAADQAYKDGNTAEAIRLFEMTNKMEPSRFQPIVRLKDIYSKDMKDDAKAEQYLLSLLKDDPDKLSYLLEAGTFYYNKGNFEKAASFYEKVKAQTPADTNNLQNLSAAYYEMKDYDNALKNTQLAINLDPSNTDNIENAKNIALMKKDKALALSYMKEILERNETEDNYSDIVNLLNEMEDYPNIIVYAQKWSTFDPNNKLPVQFIILSASMTKNKELQTRYENILKTMN